MKELILAFLKIFFRNRSTVFFVIFLPALIFVAFIFLGHSGVVDFSLSVSPNGGTGSYDDFLMAGLLAFSLMQAGVYTAGYTILDYRRRQILKRFSVSPLTGWTFLRAQIAARFCIALMQTVVLLSLGALVFHANIAMTAVFLPFAVFLGCAIFVNIGFLIASVARDYEQAAIYTSIIGLTSSFLGDVFFPAHQLPGFLSSLANYLPLRPLSVLFRFLLSGGSYGEAMPALVVLMLWFIGLSALANYVFVKRAYR